MYQCRCMYSTAERSCSTRLFTCPSEKHRCAITRETREGKVATNKKKGVKGQDTEKKPNRQNNKTKTKGHDKKKKKTREERNEQGSIFFFSDKIVGRSGGLSGSSTIKVRDGFKSRNRDSFSRDTN